MPDALTAPATRLIVGLGNPGAEYVATRHNVGFRIIDLLAKRLDTQSKSIRHQGIFSEANVAVKQNDGSKQELRLFLIKPQTFMNRSGITVFGFQKEFDLNPENILVVVDDIALPVGSIRLRATGSAGGHNGLKDIEARLESRSYPRMRVGVGEIQNTDTDLIDHVLGSFTQDEERTLAPALEQAVEATLSWVTNGVDVTMNQFNTRKAPEKDPASKVNLE